MFFDMAKFSTMPNDNFDSDVPSNPVDQQKTVLVFWFSLAPENLDRTIHDVLEMHKSSILFSISGAYEMILSNYPVLAIG